MTRSMTGFGRAQSESAELSISVELKSVNHRYFELSPGARGSTAFWRRRSNRTSRPASPAEKSNAASPSWSSMRPTSKSR